MEELLKIAYRNFMDVNDANNSKSIRIINTSWKEIDEVIDNLRKILSEKIFDDVYEKITDGASDIQEAAFVAGFACCAKFLTNGKTDLLPND